MIQRINPFSQLRLAEIAYSSDSSLEIKLEALSKMQLLLNQTHRKKAEDRPPTKSDFLRLLSQQLLVHQKALAEAMSEEMGKPIAQSRAEVEKSAWACEFYARKTEASPRIQPGFSVHREPSGILFAIMPWNFPLWQIIRCLAPNIALGNCVLVKPADLSAGTALVLDQVLKVVGHALGLPHPLAQVICMDHAQAAKVIQDPRVRGVTFTGSVEGGRTVAGLAARALKKSVRELGGSDPYIVFADADLRTTASDCAHSRMQNAGQSCVAGKRFFIQTEVYDDFLHLFLQALKSFKWGDPQDLTTELGPLVAARMRTALQDQGAHLLQKYGFQSHEIMDQSALDFEKHCPAFMAPKWIEAGQAKDFHDLWTVELFGPLPVVWSFQDEAEVLAKANASNFGLGAAVFSRDGDRALRMAQSLECGLVAINSMVKSDPRYPFGGCKDSGYGRELGDEGLFEFANIKSVTQSPVTR